MTATNGRDELAEAFEHGGIIVCLTQCWACKFGDHFDPPQWHTWADSDDIGHAKRTDQPDPSKSRCGCDCADAPKPAEVIRLPRRPAPPPARKEHPLRKTPARFRWLDAVAAGSVQAYPCDVFKLDDHGHTVGHEVIWYASGVSTLMTNWLGHPEVYPLWVPIKRAFYATNAKRIIRLTDRGQRLLNEWRGK